MTLLLHSAFKQYKEADHGHSDKTTASYLGDIGGFIKFVGPSLRLGDVEASDYQDWIEALGVAESAASRKFWALKHFFAFYGLDPFHGATSSYQSSWNTHPIPSGTLYAMIMATPRNLDEMRARLMIALAFDRLFPREQYWLVINDLQLDMGLVRVGRGILSLNTTTQHILDQWLEVRVQYGKTPLLLTGANGKQVGYDYLLSLVAHYTQGFSDVEWTLKSVIARRFLEDYRRLALKRNPIADLGKQWQRPDGFARNVLVFLAEEGYLDASG